MGMGVFVKVGKPLGRKLCTHRFSTLKIWEFPKLALSRAPGRLRSYGFGICGHLAAISKQIKFQLVSSLLIRLALYYGFEAPFSLN